jgi:LAO/AO transport system kinase
MIPGAGDELQGIKRGLLELVDMVAVNKADGEDSTRAQRAARQIETALHIFRGGDQVPVLTCSALRDHNVDNVWKAITTIHTERQRSGKLEERRRTQALRWMWSLVDENIAQRLRHDPATRDVARSMERAVRDGRVPPVEAALAIVTALLGHN